MSPRSRRSGSGWLSGARSPLGLAPAAPDEPAAVGDIDVGAFRSAFLAMSDIHEFFPLLRRFGLGRRAALDIMGEDHVRRLAPTAARALLERAAADALPIMCFVGNRGCIQIHHGPVTTIKTMGPWLERSRRSLQPAFARGPRRGGVARAQADPRRAHHLGGALCRRPEPDHPVLRRPRREQPRRRALAGSRRGL